MPNNPAIAKASPTRMLNIKPIVKSIGDESNSGYLLVGVGPLKNNGLTWPWVKSEYVKVKISKPSPKAKDQLINRIVLGCLCFILSDIAKYSPIAAIVNKTGVASE